MTCSHTIMMIIYNMYNMSCSSSEMEGLLQEVSDQLIQVNADAREGMCLICVELQWNIM